MLVVRNNKDVFDWGDTSTIAPLEYRGDVILVFDPSKTNMAMFCCTPAGNVLDVFEFSGNNRRKGPVMDTTRYCLQVRQFLKQYLTKANLFMAFTEQALTYKGDKANHITNMALTEVRSNLLEFFLEHYGIQTIEINNWSWKFAILPEGYRQKYAKGDNKGSKRWMRDFMPDSPFGKYFEADVSDCFCILLYVLKTYLKGYVMHCDRSEDCSYEYQWIYTSTDSALLKDKTILPYNTRFSLQDNINYYLNRVASKFALKFPVSAVNISTIPKHALMFTFNNIDDKEVACIVWRK